MGVDHYYQTIPGWCDYADYYASVIAALPDGAHLVEVGVYQGQSTACLAVEIANSGKAMRLDVVDWFQGSPNEMGPHRFTNAAILRGQFEAHIEPVRDRITSIHAMKSTEAAALYADESLDFVWIDAAHDSPSVLADLTAWWPKIKPGGILAGHDADWPSVEAAVLPWGELSGVNVNRVSVRSWEATKPIRVSDWLVPSSERRCLVAVASNERTIYRQTVESLMALGWGQRVLNAADEHGFRDVSFSWISRQVRVDDLRNEAVLVAQAAKASHLLFLDADMTWPANVITKMLAHHDKGIVSGLYHMKSWPNYPVSFSTGRVNLQTRQVDYVYHDIDGTDGLRSAALVGMGCALIPMRLFDVMDRPWFEYRQDPRGVWSVTEDVAFCQKAAALGCPIWLDPSIKCGHVNADVVGESHYMRSSLELAKLEELRAARAEAVPA